ncbi:hypothetical protein A7A76_07675 [Lysobacter enzymogenes]|uniref:hypothetical protein n=1 Tax=Lysobacter enzymogenes TaxID=69 RepID=UPI0019D1BA84|nr:hypothetical protein [Lysobacter enzymogenes]MBN7138972.1 hypothetical protein [Lysobacter enzymogenes]
MDDSNSGAAAPQAEQAAPRFYWNGIKDAKGAKLQRAYYSDMGPRPSVSGKYPAHTISIYARDYERFSALVRSHFVVENNSDGMTDYFENDSIRVVPSHPLYPQVKAAMDARSARVERRNGGGR